MSTFSVLLPSGESTGQEVGVPGEHSCLIPDHHARLGGGRAGRKQGVTTFSFEVMTLLQKACEARTRTRQLRPKSKTRRCLSHLVQSAKQGPGVNLCISAVNSSWIKNQHWPGKSYQKPGISAYRSLCLLPSSSH